MLNVLMGMILSLAFVVAQADEIGVLWKISPADQSLAPSYVLGTMHTEDPRVTNLAQPITQALSRAESASFEIKMDAGTMLQSLGKMYLPKGQALKDVIAADIYPELIERLAERGFPEVAIKRMKPWAVTLLISMPKQETGMFLDLLLYQRAELLEIPTYGLETLDEQLSFFEGLTIDEQVELLKETLRQLESMPDFLEEMHTLYLQRDLQGLWDFYKAYSAETDTPELMEKFEQQLLFDRNHRMVERMLPRLQEGSAFIAVGALHLPAEQGILELLREQGYAISAVY